MSEPQLPTTEIELATHAAQNPGTCGRNTRHEITIPQEVMEKWQSIVDTMAELVNVPAGLVMRIADETIEVLVSSRTAGNPYHPGDSEHLANSGLYCETVINSSAKLIVPNALVDRKWDRNPDIELNMISYLGYPVLWPDNTPFGTICVLDSKENSYNSVYERLIQQFRDVIEHNLKLIYVDTAREHKFTLDREQQDEALRLSEERFRFLVEHAADDFLLHDDQGRILDVNRQTCDRAGRSREQLLGTFVSELPIGFGDEWNAAEWQRAQTGQMKTIQSLYRDPAGRNCPVEIRFSCQILRGSKLFLGLIRDMSERVEAEERLLTAQAELARASRLSAMGEFAGSFIHETAQPITAMVTYAEACLHWLDPDQLNLAEAREAIASLLRAGHRAGAVAAGFKALARKSPVNLMKIDINDTIREVLDLMRIEFEHNSILIQMHLCSGVGKVLGDRIQLQQVVSNLLRNAIDSMKEIRDRSKLIKVTSEQAAFDEIVISS